MVVQKNAVRSQDVFLLIVFSSVIAASLRKITVPNLQNEFGRFGERTAIRLLTCLAIHATGFLAPAELRQLAPEPEGFIILSLRCLNGARISPLCAIPKKS